MAMVTERSEPIRTTNKMAFSVSPNQRTASGIQQMLGSDCKLTSNPPTVSSRNLLLDTAKPRFIPSNNRQAVTDEHALHGNGNTNPKAVVGKAVPQGVSYPPRGRKKIWRPDAQFRYQGPDAEKRGIEDDLLSEFFHRRTPLPGTC